MSELAGQLACLRLLEVTTQHAGDEEGGTQAGRGRESDLLGVAMACGSGEGGSSSRTFKQTDNKKESQ